ncbi:hypothetical protein XA68_10105 [Ophiocordyceps unilateralis]|uniref:Uncharacterized protein n=1 Tax=Ophiocordyceps unilateralis TaxID=268505 RepID=A0A2A9PJ41_OPHUN|nr:hypothetical protein XA68_10105 [Ophiocordyceps unilateralis]
MPRGTKYPSSFCEWVIGKNIDEIAASQAKKQPVPKRDIVRVEVTTDDETEADSLTVTYPRSARSAPVNKADQDVVIKKVRFQQVPSKSALKKTTIVSVKSDSEPSDSTSKSEEASTDAGSKPHKSKKKKKCAVVDPDPHPTCQCNSCVRGRDSLKNKAETDEAQSSASDSDASSAEAVVSKPSPEKKGGNRRVETDADYEASSEPSTNSEDQADQASKPDKVSKKQKSRERRVDKSEAPQKSEGSHKASAAKGKGKQSRGRPIKDYPEAFPGPHPRRPHLIEPIRAEVVQTERVVESAEDPPPNAFYDPTHGVLRVYHGPVYGGQFGHALYPRRGASGRPLPMGTPHPLQNPYLHGFNQAPPEKQGQPQQQPQQQQHPQQQQQQHPQQQQQQHPQQQQQQQQAPITQAMPVSSFQAMCPPPTFASGGYATGGYAPGGYVPGGYAPGGHVPSSYPYGGVAPTGVPVPVVWPQATAPTNGSKGAFSMCGANGASPLSRNTDNGGANNVAPPGNVEGKNPYYAGRSRTQAGAAGGRAVCDASQPNGSPAADGGWPSSDGAAEATQACAQTAWGNSDETTGWRNSETPWGNGTDADQATKGWSEQCGGQGAANGEAGWDDTYDSGPAPENNIMPGSWETEYGYW